MLRTSAWARCGPALRSAVPTIGLLFLTLGAWRSHEGSVGWMGWVLTVMTAVWSAVFLVEVVRAARLREGAPAGSAC